MASRPSSSGRFGGSDGRSRGSLLLTIGICLILIPTATRSVDKSKFRTCDQASFCRRNRNQSPASQGPWNVVPHSYQTESDSGEFQIRDEKAGTLLKTRLQTVNGDEGGTVRLTIDELNGQRARYGAPEALIGSITYSAPRLVEETAEKLVLETGRPETIHHHRLEILMSPFSVVVIRVQDNLPLVIFNHRRLMRFESHHPRDQQQNSEDLGEGAWEESFGSHQDSKPYGPMSVGMDFTFPGSSYVYGIPEHADRFPLRDTKGHMDPYRLYNVDIFEYEVDSPMSLYGAVPFMVSHSARATVGLFWLNPSETFIDVESESSGLASGMVSMLSGLVGGGGGGNSGDEFKGKYTHWFSETGLIDVWLTLGPGPVEVMQQYAKLTGTTHLPPYYAIGYHQCRWNYYTQDEVMGVDGGYDEWDIPLDSVWLDVEYTEHRAKKYFTWDRTAFPSPDTMAANLTSKGRRLIAIIDPHLKKEEGYSTFMEARDNSYFVKDKSGNDYEGWCWPGASYWPDYLSPAVRDWWAAKFKPEFFPGFNGLTDIWNDMNEPSVFNGPEVTAPRDLIHANSFEHRDLHNIYGHLMIMATHDGHMKYRSDYRSFILTRSFFAGSQRYAAVWTGDNQAKWNHLQISTPMMLGLNIGGITFSGADIPGFFFNPESDELVIRWYQTGIWHPFFRGHAHHDTRRREPWFFDASTRSHIRDAIRMRYEFLPYWYTNFRENELTGLPLMRPLWMHFHRDEKTFPIDHAFLVGEHVLVQPIVHPDVKSVDVYLPQDETQSTQWFCLDNMHLYPGGAVHSIPVTLSSIPVFYRSGSIIPKRYRVRRSATFTLNDPITLTVFPSKDGIRAMGTLYLDDGQTYKYQTDSAFISANITLDSGILTYNIIDGSLDTKVWLERVVFLNWPQRPRKVEANYQSADRAPDEAMKVSISIATKYDQDRKILVLRKPGLALNKSWSIQLIN